MREAEKWDRFYDSGKIDDYLVYAGIAMSPDETFPAVTGTPEIGAAQMVAMNNALELSGIGGMNTFGTNNLHSIARQEEINRDASVRHDTPKTY